MKGILALLLLAGSLSAGASKPSHGIRCGTDIETGELVCSDPTAQDDIMWPECGPALDIWVLIPYTIPIWDFPWFETGWKWVLIHVDGVPCQ
jgi:hypothetical protein